MPFLENLAEGLGEAAGNEGVVNRIEKQKADRQATSQEELHARTKMILNDVQGVQQKIAALDPNAPDYQVKSQQYKKELGDLQQIFTDLYHPVKNPGALQQLGGILNKIRGKQTPAASSGPSMTDRMAQANVAGAGAPQAQPDKMAEVKKAYKATFGTDMPNEQAQQFFKHLYGGAPLEPKAPHYSDYAQGLRRFVEAEGGDPDNPTAAQEDAYRKQRTQETSRPKDRYAWKRDPKTNRLVSVKLDEKNQIIPGTENPNIVPPAGLEGRISTSFYHYIDEKGQVHQIQETRTSVPAGRGGTTTSVPGAKAATKTPGHMKKELQDKVVGFKGNKDYNDTKAAYEGAIDRTDTMEKNLENALKGDQQAMLSLVANHIGMTLGTQKGARITRAVWDEAVESAPWLARVAARFDERGFLTGVTLAPEQMKQMVRLAHEKTQTLKDHLARLDTERGASSGPKIGTVEDGYRFKGGNPADRNSWEKVTP